MIASCLQEARRGATPLVLLPLAVAWSCAATSVGGAHEPPVASHPADSGFVARAQRSDLIVVGSYTAVSVGMLGCDNTFEVEAVLRGTMVGKHLRLHRSEAAPEGYCMPPDDRRWVLTLDTDLGGYRLPDVAIPEGTSWKLAVGEDGQAYGDVLRCHGVTKIGANRVTNEQETISLGRLESLVSGPPVPLCLSHESVGGHPRRTIEGVVRNHSGSLRRARVRLGTPGPYSTTLGAAKTVDGRFRFEGVPGDFVELLSEDGAFDPFLIPPGVTEVRVVSPWYAPAEQPADQLDFQDVSDRCDERCGENPSCRADCFMKALNAGDHTCQECLIDSYRQPRNENEIEAAQEDCATICKRQ